MSTPTPKTWDEAVDEILDDFSLNVVTRRGDYKGFRDGAKSALNNAVKERDVKSYEQGFTDGMSEVWNQAMYYLADTKRKTIPIEWIKRLEPKYPLHTSKERL